MNYKRAKGNEYLSLSPASPRQDLQTTSNGMDINGDMHYEKSKQNIDCIVHEGQPSQAGGDIIHDTRCSTHSIQEA